MSTENLLAFAAAACVLIAIPGPTVLFVVGRALTVGRRGALASVAANATGLLAQVVAVAFGLGALVHASVAVFTAVKLVGATYLIYLGVQAVRHRHAGGEPTSSAPSPAQRRSWRRILREGFVVGATNPKSLVLFAAILPQFVDHGAEHLPVQMVLLGLVAVTIALVSDSVWAMAAGTARAWFGRSPRRLAALGSAGGLAMVGLGTHLAVTGRRP